MKLVLPEAVASEADVVAVADEIRGYLTWCDHERVRLRAGAKPSTAVPLSAAAELLVAQCHKGAAPTTTQLDELSKQLAHLAHTAPQLHITLAAVPTAGFKKGVVTWCREQIHPTTLVSFSFNSTLLGGMVVRAGSHIFDWSFRRQIMAERGRFSEVLDRV